MVRLGRRAVVRIVYLPTEQRTTAQGQVYFIHRSTGVSTWHDPRFRQVVEGACPRSVEPVPRPLLS